MKIKIFIIIQEFLSVGNLCCGPFYIFFKEVGGNNLYLYRGYGCRTQGLGKALSRASSPMARKKQKPTSHKSQKIDKSIPI